MFGGGLRRGTAALRGSGPCCRGGIDAPHAGGYTNRNFGARFPAFPAQGRFLLCSILKLLQKQPEVVAAALAARHSAISLDEFLDLDRRRRAALAEVEALKSKRNTESAEVARRKKAGEDASDLVAELGVLSDRIKALDVEAEALKDEVAAWMLNVPNIPDASVPVGKDETENVEVRRWGEQPKFSFPPQGTLGTGRGPRRPGLRTGGQTGRSALFRLARMGRPA